MRVFDEPENHGTVLYEGSKTRKNPVRDFKSLQFLKIPTNLWQDFRSLEI